MDLSVYKNQLIFNSYYRSGNVFLGFLFSKLSNYPQTQHHITELYSDTDVKNVVMFRNPYDSISSVIIKRRVDSKVDLPSLDNDFDLSFEIDSLSEEYLHYVKEAQDNFNQIYVGHFETMIQDPIAEIRKICKFFNLTFLEPNKSFEELYNEIKEELFNREGPAGAENLMTAHDGHMPREKIEARILVDQLVKESNSLKLKEAYETYSQLKYTEVL